MAKGLLLSIIVVLTSVVAQAVVVHMLRPVKVFNTMALLFLLTVPVFLVLYDITPRDLYVLPESLARTPAALGCLNGLLVHILLYCTWVEAFYYIDRPVTLRILVEFAKSPGGYLTLSEIRGVYGLEQMITSRLESMRINGYLEEQYDRYILTRKGKALARAIQLVRQALRVPYYFDARFSVSERECGAGTCN